MDTLTLIMPFLIEKRRQAQLLLLIPNFPPRSAQRESIMRELKALKRIDYGG